MSPFFYRRSFEKSVRLKNIKFSERPNVEELIREIQLMTGVMNDIVQFDGPMDSFLTITTTNSTVQTNRMESQSSSSDQDLNEEEEDSFSVASPPSSLSVSRSSSCSSLQSLDSVECVSDSPSSSPVSSLPLSCVDTKDEPPVIIVPDET